MKIERHIAVRGIAKAYGAFTALADIDLHIEPGEFLTLLGPSGSGKSTLLMVLAGFTRPDAGSILVDGREFVTVPPHQRNIGLVFQNYALFPHMTVAKNVGFPLRYRRMSRVEADERVARALSLVQLTELADRSIDELSGGQRQRVALARAFVFDPTILLMDEPLSALDKKLRDYMQVELRQLHKRLGTTTIYVTHDQREALTMSDRIAVLNRGRIVQIGTPRDIYERPNGRFVADFLGDTQFLRAEVLSASTARVGASTFRVAHSSVGPGAIGQIVLRPEKLSLLTPADPSDDLNTVSCTVRNCLYQGEHVLVDVEVETGETILVRRGSGAATMSSLPEQGSRGKLAIHPDDTVVVGDG